MKLYDGGRVPNARRVRIFLAEKGLTLPLIPVDLASKEHHRAEFAAKNPSRRVPVLELDDGTCVSESIAICRYFEELNPRPPLFGLGPLEQAMVEMWNRRVEFEFYGAIQAVFRHLHPGMVDHEVPQVKEWGEANRPKVLDQLARLDARLAQEPFLAGERFTVADITALVSVDFLKVIKVAVSDDFVHLKRWHGEVAARPSAAA